MRKLCDWLDARTDYRRILAPIQKRTLAGGPSWWLTSGSLVLWLFVIELITGLALMVTYSPSMASAWASVHYINQSPAGAFLRGLHFYTSHALILAFFVHLIRVVLMAAFRPPRELIWITGLLLIPLTIVWTVTGNPLSANQKGMAQIDVEGKIIASTPLVGPPIQRILIGGDAPGNLTLTHLYFLHVGLLPVLVLVLLGVHIAQVYRHGISSQEGHDTAEESCAYWPHQTLRNMVVLSVVVAIIAIFAWRVGAPLDAPMDSSLPHTPRPEWYFRWLFELRRYLTGDWEFLATVVLPLVVLFYFLLLPAVDRALRGRWSAALRLLTVLLGVAVVGGLTWMSFARDWNDQEFVASERTSRELAARARFLAQDGALPVEGAVTLLRNDPKTQGPLLYRRHCAACHPYTDAQGQGLAAAEPSAPNLYGFGSPAWLAALLDPAQFVSPQYFGKTKFVDGEMASKLREMFDEADDPAALRQQMALAARALAAEAKLASQSAADRDDAPRIAEGVKLIQGDLACTECHRFGDVGELGSAPDLTGYGSREWLAGIIANPQHERFYPEDRNDRMPAFAADGQQPQRNILGPRELDLLVAWLRGEWEEAEAPAPAQR